VGTRKQLSPGFVVSPVTFSNPPVSLFQIQVHVLGQPFEYPGFRCSRLHDLQSGGQFDLLRSYGRRDGHVLFILAFK
jgi:hypothetical protein